MIFVSENGDGPGVRLRKGEPQKPTAPPEPPSATYLRAAAMSESKAAKQKPPRPRKAK